MDQALVSVIIPTFNRAHLIRRAIDSALAQTHMELEVIVVDDGSTDGTRELICQYSGANPRVRYLSQENRGVAAARNRGLAVARGDYIALLDSDDVWKPWKIALQLCCMRYLGSVGMVWTDMEALDASGNIISSHYLRTMYGAYNWFRNDDLFNDSCPVTTACPDMQEISGNSRLYWGDIFSQMIMGNLVHTSTVLLSRERLAKVGGFNEALRISGEDYDFHLRTCREGAVAFIDLAAIEYQVGMPDQLTRSPYQIYIAENYLKTIAPVIAQDRDRIKLPPHMLTTALAKAHGWIGSELFELGRYVQTRPYLLRSLRYRLWQPRTMLLLAVSIAPPGVIIVLRRWYRYLRHRLMRR